MEGSWATATTGPSRLRCAAQMLMRVWLVLGGAQSCASDASKVWETPRPGCWYAALLAVVVWSADAHESDTTVEDCLEQAVVGDRWHVRNQCDYTVQASWCIVEGQQTCPWHTPTMLSAGDSYSTGRLSSQPLRTRLAGCRSEVPDYGGMVAGVDWRTGEYKCLIAVPGTSAIGGGNTVEDANPLNHCMEPVAHEFDGALALRNRCDYVIEIAWCGLEGWPDDDPLRCGAEPGSYYTMFSEVVAGDSKHMHSWKAVDAVACGVRGQSSFDPDGFKGKGGYRCLEQD